MMGVFAEFEREIIRERVRAGLARAKAKGRSSAQHYPEDWSSGLPRPAATPSSATIATPRRHGCGWSWSDRQPYYRINEGRHARRVATGPDGKPFLAPVSVPDDNMALGIEMLESGGDREVISRNLGEGQKIRSFTTTCSIPTTAPRW